MPRGMSRLGLADSSAASGTPSTAKNSQMPNGSAESTPPSPKGKSAVPPSTAGAMLNRFAASKCGAMPTKNAMSATMATAVMPNTILSASPTPIRWMPTNTMKKKPMIAADGTLENRPSACTYAAMNVEIAAGQMVYSMRMANPVSAPPTLPMARRAKP